MKSAHYLLFLSLNLSTNAFANSWLDFAQKDTEHVCNKIGQMGEQDSYYTCETIMPPTFTNKKQFVDACSSLLIRKYSGEKNYDLKDECKSTMEILTEIKVDKEAELANEIIATGSVAPDDGLTELTISQSMTECKLPDEGDVTCTPANIMDITPIEDVKSLLPTPNTMMTISVSPKYSVEECKCLDKNIEKNYLFQKKSKKDFVNDLNKEKKNINDLIFKTASKKFLNDFASHVEDVNYYLSNKSNALDPDPKKATSLICTSSDGFEKSVAEACKKNGVTADVQQQRIESILGVYGDFIDDKSTESKFTKLTLDILIGESEEKTRYNYDLTRSGVISMTPQVKFIDELTSHIFEDPELTKILDQKIAGGDKPGKAILSMLEDKQSPAIKNLIERITSPKLGFNLKNRTFYNNLKLASQSILKNDLRDMAEDAYKVATAYYPGFKAVFKNPETFKKLKELSKSDKSIITTLESNPSLLGGYYMERCEKLKKKFAQMVCTKDTDYIRKTSPLQLNKYLTNTSIKVNPELKDSLLCHAARGSEDEYIFSNLGFASKNNVNISDYHLRKDRNKQNPNNDTKGGYAKYLDSVKGKNDEVANFVQRASSLGEKKKSHPGDFDSFVTSPKKEVIPTISSNNKVSGDKTSETILNNNNINFLGAPAPVQSYATPSSNQVTNVIRDTEENKSSVKSSKSLLREFLADEKNKAEVDKLLSQTSDDDLQKLMKLKEEIALDQKKYQELLQDTEKAKLKAMEENLIAMEKEIKAPVKVQPSERKKEYQGPSYFQGGAQSGALSGSMVQRDSSGPTGSSVESSPLGGASASSGSSNSMAVRAPASKSESGTMSTTHKGAAIIIESPTVRSNEQFAREDLSKEVISYVNQTELDVQTLKNLKESGLVLKFKVLKDGIEMQKEVKVDYSTLTSEAKKILDQKIAQQEKNLEYERLKRAHSYAALKLILGLKVKEQQVN